MTAPEIDNQERMVLVDRHGRALVQDGEIVSMPKMEAHLKGLRHLAVSVFVFNSRGSLLLQKRALSKYHSPGLWTNTCCTHPAVAEPPLDAARRRLFEEMGLRCDITPAFTLAYRADVGGGLTENEFDHIFIGHSDASPHINPAEVADWQWAGRNELAKRVQVCNNQFTAWFLVLWPAVVSYINR